MKKKISGILCLLAWMGFASAQSNADRILSEIEKNNTTLAALRENSNAEKIRNVTGLAFENPDVEFHYLWGTPSSMGNRIDFNIRQSMDFPTAYAFKTRIAKTRNLKAEVDLRKQRNDILFRARLLLVNVLYLNKLHNVYVKRREFAERVAASYKMKFETGETNILEFNKAQLQLLTIRQETEKIEIEKESLLSELTGFNNGIPVAYADTVYLEPLIPDDFDQWFRETALQIPELKLIQTEIELGRKEEQLSFALSLPKISAGYMSESIQGEKLRGITAGISIPLWENSNKVKFAKAKTLALTSLETDLRTQAFNRLRTLHSKVIRLKKVTDAYRSSVMLVDHTGLLSKALSKGELTLLEYIMELSVYYGSVDAMLDSERELNEALAGLYQFAL